ncbi:MAG TPA: hypothetical protein VFH95_08845 [Candidatus Kapabacteria bacterium]|nr:hypothetical protein [Candidatus Kapabacteria bacterium]
MIRRLLPISLLLFALSAKAQPVVISPIVSFDYGSPLFINRAPGVLNPLPGNLSGSSSGASYGLGGQITLPIVGSLGLMGGMEAVYSTGSFASSAISISGNDFKLLMEAAAEWESSQFAVSAGPWISQRFAGGHVLEQDSNGTNITPSNAMSSATHLGLFAGLICNIHNFPLRPELNTHLDFTELPQAGVNAWSFGLSLAFVFGRNEKIETPSNPTVLPPPFIPHASSFLASVKFLVNGSPSQGSPPLERVETRIKDYRMVDSANAAPRITQWDEESYHLPHLALHYLFLRRNGANLMLFKDSLRLLEKIFPGTTDSVGGIDTVLDLEQDSAWQTILTHLNTGENNRLIAELLTNSEVIRDTLVLPPADTSRAAKTIVKQEFRFELSDNFNRYTGGREALDLLLARMKELLDSVNTIRIQEGTSEQNSAGHAALEKKIEAVLGNRESLRAASADVSGGCVVVMER